MKLASLNSKKIMSHINDIKKDVIKYEIKRTLEEKYNINAEQIEASEQSTDGNVYIAYCSNTRYVIKIYDSLEHTKSMIELHKELETIDLNTPRIIIPSNRKGLKKY